MKLPLEVTRPNIRTLLWQRYREWGLAEIKASTIMKTPGPFNSLVGRSSARKENICVFIPRVRPLPEDKMVALCVWVMLEFPGATCIRLYDGVK